MSRIGESISLDPNEIKTITYLAKCRQAITRANGVIDRKMGDQDWLETELQGLAGEFAYCKMFNMYPDFSVHPRSGGYDCKDDYGFKYDIKTTKHHNGRLLKTLKHNPDVDYYVLMTGQPPTYIYRGEVIATDLVNANNIVDLGHGQGYAMTQEQIRKVNEL